jgi:HAD superfamily hydrolase (TIGR01490 family)
MKIAFFDFDGTITKQDSFIMFLRYCFGDTKFLLGILILFPKIIAYKLKLLSNQNIKTSVLNYFFKNMSAKEFKKKSKSFSLEKIKLIVREKALNKINWHKQNGDLIVIVSASIDYWLEPWCTKNGISLIATQIEIKNNKLTGNLIGNNCFGPEKVARIKLLYNLEDYDYIYAYGDTKGDREMLKIATESFYKPFR